MLVQQNDNTDRTVYTIDQPTMQPTDLTGTQVSHRCHACQALLIHQSHPVESPPCPLVPHIGERFMAQSLLTRRWRGLSTLR